MVVPSQDRLDEDRPRRARARSRATSSHDLRVEGEALRLLDRERATSAATGARLQELWRRIDLAKKEGTVTVPEHAIARMRVTLEAGAGQGPPLVLAHWPGRRGW